MFVTNPLLSGTYPGQICGRNAQSSCNNSTFDSSLSCQVNFCLIISSLSKAKGDQTCCLNVDHLVNSTICPLIQLTLLHKRPVQSPHMLCYCLYSTNAHLTVLCFIIHLLFHIINDFVVVVVVLPVCHLPLLLWTSQSSFHFNFEPLSLP